MWHFVACNGPEACGLDNSASTYSIPVLFIVTFARPSPRLLVKIEANARDIEQAAAMAQP